MCLQPLGAGEGVITLAADEDHLVLVAVFLQVVFAAGDIVAETALKHPTIPDVVHQKMTVAVALLLELTVTHLGRNIRCQTRLCFFLLQ